MDLIVRNARIADHPSDRFVDIGIDNGRIAAIEPGLAAEGASYDASGRLVCGGFVETHIHLDKSCIIDRCAPETERQPYVVKRVAAVKRSSLSRTFAPALAERSKSVFRTGRPGCALMSKSTRG